MIGELTLERLERGFGLGAGSLSGVELAEELGCDCLGSSEFGLQPGVLVLQPLELLLRLDVGLFAISELALQCLERDLGLGAGGFGGTQPFEQFRSGGLGVGELRLELLVLALQLA